ncbi:protein SLX4IP isoform X4 [Dermochelys coriacea]|uniref:protein SLX4IP isoform X4 n=1 Tax=Dermochelys coriacea TaxID=27794 RepID=UPI001CA86EEC|nr:protein SLX4IP isoform X4 [Dermochelys coriacea]
MASSKFVIKTFYSVILNGEMQTGYTTHSKCWVPRDGVLFIRGHCGNFAVLVDFHILPQGSSRDSSWFSDHEKEELCLLLKDTIDSRVKHYLEARKHRGQWKHMECTQSVPLSLKELCVFPDKFVVCVTRLESNPSLWTSENGALKEKLSSGTSEYFAESTENKKCKIPPTRQIKQDILQKIVKRTETRNSNMSKPQTSKDTMQVYLGSGDSEIGSRKKEHQAPSDPQSEVKCRSIGQPKDCMNTAESNSELPALELENHVNQRQPDDASSQQTLHSAEWLKMRLLSSNSPCSCESALPGPKESQRMTKTQNQQKSCGSEEGLDHCKKVSSEQGHLIPKDVERKKSNSDCLEPSSEEKSLLNPKLFSKQDLAKAMSDEESLTLGKIPPRPVLIKNNIPVIQTNQNEPAATTEELSLMPLSSYLKFNFKPSEKLIQKRKKEGEDGPRKLKLRRLKK